MVWRGVGIRLADDTPDPVITALVWPEIGLISPADGVSDCKGVNIIQPYTKLLF
jgi:hypothetical protein